jgi:CRISPR-associated endonuclease/helicase Cas3
VNRAENKASRLLQVESLLLAHPEGLTQAEIARRLQVDRATINRYLVDLPRHIYIEDDGRLKIDRTADLINVRLNLHEALSVHIAARLLATRMDRQNPHAASALRKLGVAMERWAARISRHVLQSADVMDEAAQRHDPVYLQSLEKLTLAWADQRKTQIWHHSEVADKVMEYTFSPYFIEPYAVGQTTHVIGLAEPPGKIRTFKIERIRRVEISRDPYDLPADFDPSTLLADAWGIWYTDNEPVEVVLKFHPRVARRVMETRWHRSAEEKELPDGYLLWQAQVAEPQEMLPWVRGWGADVEVLAPETLRRAVIQHVRDMAAQYKVMTPETKPYSVLWAKADKKDLDKVHRLVYHLIDVGQVALAMWRKAIDAESKRQFCQWLGCDEDAAGRTLAFLISLHDLGKASPSFQIKLKTLRDEIRRAGFWLPDTKPAYTSPHGIVSAWALGLLLPDVLKISERDAKKLARAVGGHHGAWPLPLQLKNLNATDKGNGDPSWDAARRELVHIMARIFDPIIAFTLTDEPEAQGLNAFLTLFSGFTSVADWIGSMTEFFPYEKHTNIPLEEYTARAASNAEKALSKLGWSNWQADGTHLTFAEMFPFIISPNPVQQIIIQETAKTLLPALLILESPTGSGKTESALYAADAWLQTKRGSGMYIAMPTQATSNQMYDRVTKFLCQRYPAETLNFHLVHGGALLEEKSETQTESVYDEDQPDSQGGIRAEAWFLPRKRTLLAPFGVGTVDQALMSVLQTRHFFVRMFGLKNKVVIFDEVHAYDTYMSVLFKRLLAWLKQIGVSVILLSATLSEKTRRELSIAYLGLEEVDVPPAEYPRLTIASGSSVRSIPLEPPSSRALQLMLCDTQDQTIIEHLRTAMKNGGCAAVICNRVARAQELYKKIKTAELMPAEDLILFHARFPFSWREEIETKVLGKFGKDKKGGKNPARPKKSIVVATQVIEQSLDLDFDYMVSDLAPIDLIIQRAGRLHRHSQNDATRPGNLKMPALLVAFPQNEEIPAFGHDEYVYDRSVMLKTWLALKEKTAINLPEETTALIEVVYGGDIVSQDEALRSALEVAVEKEEQGARSEFYKAKQQLIASPEDDDLLSNNNRNLDEDDPTVHHAFRAATRNSEPSVTLVCLHRVGNEIFLDPEGEAPLDASHKPEKEVVRKLLRQSVGVQKRVVVDYFTNNTPEFSWKGWKEVAALKYAFPIVFENGRCPLAGTKYVLVLDRHTGLTIQKEEQ